MSTAQSSHQSDSEDLGEVGDSAPSGRRAGDLMREGSPRQDSAEPAADNNNSRQASEPGEERHMPVLLEQAVELLDIKPGKVYVDATAGAGGHLARIAQLAGKESKIFGFDRDSLALSELRCKVPGNVELIHSNFENIGSELAARGVDTIDGGILADLGVSSMQLDDPERGFSFLRQGPLDMRMDPNQPETAEHLINNLSEAELADIIFRYGEERKSRQIAKAIVHHRPLSSTEELADLVSRTLSKFHKPSRKRRGGRRDAPTGVMAKHPATRTFQALRIAVNNEMESLEFFLEDSVRLLSPGARLVIISFHSLEDRIVKQFLRSKANACICPPRQPVCTCEKKSEMRIITRKPVVADKAELLANIRSRSAKLRAGERIP